MGTRHFEHCWLHGGHQLGLIPEGGRAALCSSPMLFVHLDEFEQAPKEQGTAVGRCLIEVGEVPQQEACKHVFSILLGQEV